MSEKKGKNKEETWHKQEKILDIIYWHDQKAALSLKAPW